MKTRPTYHLMAALLGVALTTNLHAQTSAFTYQGRLADNDAPVTGFYDLTFSVWNSASGPSQVGPTLASNAVPVSDGLFTVTLDFGAGVFDGNDRWLEIGVATNGSGVFTNLSPRQPITSAPYAIKAAGVDASAISGILPLAQLPANVVTNEAGDVNLSGNFSGDAGGLTNLDSTRLAGPLTVLPGGLVNIGQIDDGGQARSVAVAGNYAYLANDDDGLRIYEISDPTNPLSIGHTNNGSFSRGVAVSGDYVYLANFSDGLRIYDVSDPTTPMNIGHTNDGGSAWSVVVSGDYAYLADTDDGLQIFDVSNPADPQLVGQTNSGGFARDVAVSGDHAYVAGHSGGLFVYYISDPTNPVGIGQTNNGGTALGVAVSGDYLYLANGSDGLRVYDVSNPANPENIGHLAAGGLATSVVVADGYAYMAENSFLRAYDVHDPANPVEVGVFQTVFCLDVALAGNYLYLANGFDGLYVFDVAVARAPSFSGHFFGDGGGLTNLHLNSLEAADGNPAQAVYVDSIGNVGIGTDSPGQKLHVAGGITCTALTETSDRNAKENFTAVSPQEVLDKVRTLPISTWNFKELDDGRHMGPIAQDFYGTFQLGNSDTTITSVDRSGVALAAIQGLNQKLTEELNRRDAETAELRAHLQRLERLLNQKLNGGAR